jgi:NADPH:quinone reductase-like Zn-dependent oxidoreductase
MRAYVAPTGCTQVDELRIVQLTDPEPGPGQVVVRIRAASINYRDQAVVAGRYLGGSVSRDTIPLSDGAGEIEAVGAGVTQFKPADRVAATFFQAPPNGSPFGSPASLGWPLDGVMAERVLLYEDGVVPIPVQLSFEEAACLPCAGVTAWNALVRAGKPIVAGDTVLVLGTGGVSILALQFAKAAGARVIATSSSDAKLERVKELGAEAVINYTRTPAWEGEVLKLTGGRGVDCVVEVGGLGTLNRSMQCVGSGGKVVLMGVLTGMTGDVNPYILIGKNASLHGIFVGDRAMFLEMNDAIAAGGIKPLVDRVFPFEELVVALRYQAAGQFIGKVVVRV